MKINKEEIKEFIKTIRNVHNIISYNNGSSFELRRMNEYLLKAADVIESLQETLISIDTQSLECANLLENHFKTQEEIERLKQQRDDYGEEIK